MVPSFPMQMILCAFSFLTVICVLLFIQQTFTLQVAPLSIELFVFGISTGFLLALITARATEVQVNINSWHTSRQQIFPQNNCNVTRSSLHYRVELFSPVVILGRTVYLAPACGCSVHLEKKEQHNINKTVINYIFIYFACY